MRKAVFLAACLALLCGQSPFPGGFPPGVFLNRAALDPAPSVSYTGPGDLKTYVVWHGFSCYTAAYSGSVADIVDTATGDASGTRLVCSGGVVSSLSSGSACTFVTGNTCSPLATTCAVSCDVAKLYDQTAGNACDGSSCDMTAAFSTRPVLTASIINSTACASITTSSALQTVNNLTQAQPFSAAIVADRTGATASITGALVQVTGNNPRIGYANAADTTMVYAGGSITNGPAATDNANHAIGYVLNNASTLIGVDATSASMVDIGSSTGFSGGIYGWGTGSGSSFIGTLCEGGVANATWNATDIQNVNANAHARYGVW